MLTVSCYNGCMIIHSTALTYIAQSSHTQYSPHIHSTVLTYTAQSSHTQHSPHIHSTVLTYTVKSDSSLSSYHFLPLASSGYSLLGGDHSDTGRDGVEWETGHPGHASRE